MPHAITSGYTLSSAWLCGVVRNARCATMAVRFFASNISSFHNVASLMLDPAHVQELNDYDLVMNCTGLGAMKLFGDMSMYPIRGHVIRVKAPWIKNVYFLDEQTYIIPNRDTVVRYATIKTVVFFRLEAASWTSLPCSSNGSRKPVMWTSGHGRSSCYSNFPIDGCHSIFRSQANVLND